MKKNTRPEQMPAALIDAYRTCAASLQKICRVLHGWPADGENIKGALEEAEAALAMLVLCSEANRLEAADYMRRKLQAKAK